MGPVYWEGFSGAERTMTVCSATALARPSLITLTRFGPVSLLEPSV